jgi:AbrB family looped-hinge helix DNA binding protein
MAKISSKGQVTIPASVRNSVGIQSGQDVTFTPLGNGKIIVRAKSGTLADMRGIVKTKRRVPTDKMRVGSFLPKPNGAGTDTKKKHASKQ